MYLWLNCEGWIRFGPFEWLRFEDDPRVIRNQDGVIVASFDGTDWHTSDGQYDRWIWRNPMVTTSPRHPHPASG